MLGPKLIRPVPTSSGRSTLTSIAILVLILCSAVALRIHHLGKYSLWHDDFFVLEAATGRGQLHDQLPLNVLLDPAPAFTSFGPGAPGLLKIWTSLQSVTHPPLAFMALTVWCRLAGTGDVAARSFSVTWSIVGMLLLFELTRLQHGRTCALWASAIAAVAGPQIVGAQEVRSYSMALAMILAGAIALLRIEHFGSSIGRLSLLVAALLAMMLTHYLAAGSAAALFVYTLVRFRGSQRVQIVLSFAIACAIYIVIWGWFFRQQSFDFSSRFQFLRDKAEAGIWMRTWWRLTLLPARMLAEPMTNSLVAARASLIIFVIPFLLIRRNPGLLLSTLLMIGPALLITARDLLTHGYALNTLRYIYLSSLPMYAVLAGMFAYRRDGLRHLLPAVSVAACLLALDRAYDNGQPDLREPAALVRSQLQPGDVLLFSKYDSRDWLSAAYCLEICHYARPEVPIALIDRPPGGELLVRLRNARRVLFCSRNQVDELSGIFPADALHCIGAFPMAGGVYWIDLNQSMAVRASHYD